MRQEKKGFFFLLVRHSGFRLTRLNDQIALWSSGDLPFLKLPFAVRPGLTDSRVANLIVLSNCTTKMKVEMITVQGSSVKQWV